MQRFAQEKSTERVVFVTKCRPVKNLRRLVKKSRRLVVRKLRLCCGGIYVNFDKMEGGCCIYAENHAYMRYL